MTEEQAHNKDTSLHRAPEGSEENGGTDQATAVLDDAEHAASQRRFMDAVYKIMQPIAVPKVGELMDGVIIARKGPYVYIDLGPFGTGVIYGREYYNARDLIKPLKTGDAVTAKVVEIENEDGYVELSLREAGRDKIWQEAEDLMKKKQPVPMKVFAANKGGLVIYWNGVQGFLPVSQLTAKHYPRVEGGDKGRILSELQKFVGGFMDVTILDYDPKEEKLIFSEKNVESDELKETLSHYEVGQEIEGEVTGVVDFGVFVKIEEGLEGLAHISELDWGLVENPSDLFSVGENVRAKIISIEGGKISLSIKALKHDPWQDFAGKHAKGDIVEGHVKKLDKFGAFIEIPKFSLSGLVHISEFGSEKVMNESLEAGKDYHFQILNLNPADRKLSLSFVKEGGEASTKKVKKEEKEKPDTEKEE
ncbi:MAG: 30S ribosomal protein S1 [Candidatus Ryanbacteria bacterium CG10_big_fil_rev_8_21_14_0_10_43_42]|uniref:30S ribosomal protein S1 n=1 Tax=Candidatus Ryanbacteria bacterium CG10_big_fil_rev_8_21_14_0_10_43_42 TaxID=1974864 RepID=A0A2M8KX90_9BACT|nr:MAG: 30S ribosomal protein S1 [Candidatus Ryanbacteria bacterium CG10_big_fil_rev_8_21_14_0_10_43_42]